jgi:hypothetical protein
MQAIPFEGLSGMSAFVQLQWGVHIPGCVVAAYVQDSPSKSLDAMVADCGIENTKRHFMGGGARLVVVEVSTRVISDIN